MLKLQVKVRRMRAPNSFYIISNRKFREDDARMLLKIDGVGAVSPTFDCYKIAIMTGELFDMTDVMNSCREMVKFTQMTSAERELAEKESGQFEEEITNLSKERCKK